MDYTSAYEYIQGLNTRGIVPGLDNMRALVDKLNNPEKNLKFIHIAGTNGKGSVGAYLSHIITSSNINVCRFVSPCVGEYLNTFLYNNRPVSPSVFGECADKLKEAMELLEKDGIYPTTFEAETALSFLIFNKLNPDYVIIECGMGGRLDATNIIPSPLLSIITHISLDHTAFLGDTLEKIAKEKAGILKTGTKLVTINQPALEYIAPIADDLGVPIYTADETTDIVYGDTTAFQFENKPYTTSLLGTYQPQNASVAIKAAQLLGFDYNAVYKGISCAKWDFRFEKIGNFILDGAHNPDGANELAKSIRVYYEDDDLAYIFACFKDKDYKQIVKITAPYAREVFTVTAPTTRGLDCAILCDEFIKNGVKATATANLSDAVKKASKHKHIVIFGTLSILCEAKRILKGVHPNGAMQQNI